MIDYAGANIRYTPTPGVQATGWLGWKVLWFVAALLLLIVLGGLLGAVIGIFAPLVLIFLLVMLSQVMRRVRQRRLTTVIGYLHQAAGLNLPLSPMLIAAEQSEPGTTGRRIRHVRELLYQGVSVADAMEHGMPEARLRAAALLRPAEQVGRLRQGLARMLEEERRESPRAVTTISFYKAYPLVMLLMLMGVSSFLLIFVLPAYNEIFRDFDIELPALTAWTIDVMANWSWVATIVVALAVIVIAGNALGEIARGRQARPGFLVALRDTLAWRLPLLHGAERDRGMADVCQVMADALETATPFPQALEQARRLPINAELRRRVVRWRDGVTAGKSIRDAAAEARLPRVLVGMLGAGGSAADAPLFRFLARYYGARFSRMRLLLEGAVVPAVVLIMAVLVAVVGLSLFLPMVALGDQLSIVTGLM